MYMFEETVSYVRRAAGCSCTILTRNWDQLSPRSGTPANALRLETLEADRGATVLSKYRFEKLIKIRVCLKMSDALLDPEAEFALDFESILEDYSIESTAPPAKRCDAFYYAYNN